MNRIKSIEFLNMNNGIQWDVLIIGGGATGLGIALDSSLRGYKTLLLEQSDFTKGTSSRSTKLVHGGVRYLAQGDISLVKEALHERGLLLKNAPHVCSNQSFIIPSFGFFEGLKYIIGLKLYDLMAGNLSLGKSEYISSKQTIKALPGLNNKNLKNGILYNDGRFDDARLGINLAQSSVENGAHLINYMKVTRLAKNINGEITGIEAIDLETNSTYNLDAKVIINATGVFVDTILNMDQTDKEPIISVSQGTHIVLDSHFLASENALIIPKTKDGRVLFAIPWYGKLLVGTTETPVNQELLEPKALPEEIDFILSTLNKYIEKQATKKDILSIFSGLRPLVKPEKKKKNTKEISRSHKLFMSKNGLITITGGKWTTYRKMAEETINLAIKTGKIPSKNCITENFKIHGHTTLKNDSDHLHIYGTDAEKIRTLAKSSPELSEKLHPDYPYLKAEVIWAVRFEMALKVEDVLARRIRILFLDAKAAIEMSGDVAQLIAKELNKPQSWIEEQVQLFKELAKGYLAN